MRVTILVDNTARFDSALTAEHGFSLLVEAEGRRVLFDTGASDAVVRNAERLKVDLLDLDYIVLSHGHNDHTGGLYHLLRLFLEAIVDGTAHRLPRLIAHPHCFYPRPKPPLPDIGAVLSADSVRRFVPLELTASPLRLSPNLFFLGEIGRKVAFEAFSPGSRRIVLPDGTEEADYLRDDTALAYRSSDGLVIVTGCAHAGICNTVEHARRVCGEDRVAGIVGGLHLLHEGEQLRGTCEFLGGVGLSALHACHCTSLAAKVALAGFVPLNETGTGLRLVYGDRPEEP
jgi:7,8-dihydropterin-6-yl-methyl-4-(beta-D-ribofuranosyl)aminobenzene 5'-phosphate synthase